PYYICHMPYYICNMAYGICNMAYVKRGADAVSPGEGANSEGEFMAEKEYDVLIIGSGASGGMAAYTLTQKGLKCLMLDAGPPVDFQRHRGSKRVYELPYRGFGKPGRLSHVFQANEFNANTWVDETRVPYTHDPKEPYNWVRVRLVGGKSL